ncbi:MAG: hypothetical protein WBA74_10765 [Cyclobacteriaceae bacterium]
MGTIDFTNIRNLPSGLFQKLSEWDDQFKSHKEINDLKKEDDFLILMSKLDKFCRSNDIVGYHLTKAPKKDILDSGLLCRSGEEIRKLFMKQYSEKFSNEQLLKIGKKWISYFDEEEACHRDNCIYFYFNLNEENDLIEIPFLNKYGGEQIYTPLSDIAGVEEILKGIGDPIVVKCSLKPDDINIDNELPFGMLLCSAYHQSVNSAAIKLHWQGCQKKSVPPDRIKDVFSLTDIIRYRQL